MKKKIRTSYNKKIQNNCFENPLNSRILLLKTQLSAIFSVIKKDFVLLQIFLCVSKVKFGKSIKYDI